VALMPPSSRIPGFYKLTPAERLAELQSRLGLDPALCADLAHTSLDLASADQMIENVVGTLELPVGIGINMIINGRDVVVPMAIEEPSVVAAVSNMARIVRSGGGFHASADEPVMIGQIQVLPHNSAAESAQMLEAAFPELKALAGKWADDALGAYGGGLRGMRVRTVVYDEPGEIPQEMVVLHFQVHCADAMGANVINTIAERLAPHVERAANARVGLRILSNLADMRLARAKVRIPIEALSTDTVSGAQVAEGIACAYRFAYADPYRATTHNKGIMNGIDAVALATGQDWRAIEAGAHAWACRDHRYRSLSSWKVDDEHLVGFLELPLAVGIVGGSILSNPTVRANLALMNIRSARDLSETMVAVGLAQNLGALRALATEGIQRGHMRMHARNIATAAGASATMVPAVAEALFEAGDYSLARAKKVLAGLTER
jgi:hydroxymethylglutaryl-CoA reductase